MYLKPIFRQCSQSIDRIPGNIQQSAKGDLPFGHPDRTACRDHFHSAPDSIGRVHGNAPDRVLSDMLLTFNYQLPLTMKYLQ